MKKCECGGKGYKIVNNVMEPCICGVKRYREKIWKMSGIPYVYWDLDVDMIDLNTPSIEEMEKNESTLKIINNYKANFKEMVSSNIGLYIKGAHGNGKTLVACDIAKHVSLLKKEDGSYHKVFFCTFKGALNIMWGGRSYDPLFQNVIDQEKQRELFFEYWNNSDLRIIDVVGKEGTTKSGNEASVLDELARSNAYGEKKSIIFTSNILTEKLSKIYNANIDSILSDKIIHIEMHGGNFRKTKVETIKEKLLK